MKAAIIGQPRSGKTTLAGAIAGAPIEHHGQPQVHQLTVKVPEPRLDKLADLFQPKKVTHANIEYIDVPGFSLADQHGRDLLRRLLPDVRQCELLVAVVRDFTNSAVPPYRDRIDPRADIAELRDEFVFADLETISNRTERLEKALKKPTKTHDQEKREFDVLEKCKDALENETPLSAVLTSPDEQKTVASFALLTLKPLLVVFNVSEERAADPDPDPLPNTVGTLNVCAQTEMEIAQLAPDDRAAFLQDLGIDSPAGDRLIRACYNGLGLMSFFTAGPPEVRAWTLKQNSDAVQAAAVIHSDMARGFIRAETVAYEDLMAAGDMRQAKADGKVRQEGKAYIVQDADVILFKFNV